MIVLRDGHEKKIDVTLDEAAVDASTQSAADANRDDTDALGVAVAPVTPELAEQFGVAGTVHGLVVEQVRPNGRAAAAGLMAGDVIEEVNRKPVATIEELRSAVRATTDRPLLLLVHRQGADVYVPVRQAVH
jgi:serine protease Do